MKTLLIDDERLARSELRSMLSGYDSLEIIGEAANGNEALSLIEEHDPELLFLDIQMPEISGFELLSRLEKAPHVIFVTAYDEYAIRAFEVNAFDYLLKPVEEDRLAAAIEKITSAAPSAESISQVQKLHPEDRIFIKDGEKCWFVPLADIRLFESEGNYVRVWFNDEKPLILRSLNQLEVKLDEQFFFRTSRKHIVNLSCIAEIEPWFNGGLRCKLADGKEIEVSRRQASRFKELKSI